MKKLLTISLSILVLGLISAEAKDKKADKGDHKRPAMTEEQKKTWKEVTEKYDTDKDGKLSKEEREKVSKEDKQKLKDAGIGGHKKDEKK
jgi:hypothetical protein